MLVRVTAALGMILAMTAAARASSFVVLGDAAPSSTPSIITLGMPAPVKIAEAAPRTDPSLDPMQQALLSLKPGSWQAAPTRRVATIPTPSIIALGDPLPDVTYEKVAAIPQKSNRGPVFSPLVIRGGIAGDAFAPAVASASASSAPAKQNPTSHAPAKPDAPAPAERSPALLVPRPQPR